MKLTWNTSLRVSCNVASLWTMKLFPFAIILFWRGFLSFLRFPFAHAVNFLNQQNSEMEKEFKIRSDYVFHHRSSTWMFSHSVLWNATTLCACRPLPLPPPSGCIIIYGFHCSEGRKQEKIVLVVLFTTHSDIQFSRQTGRTFICVVMANPCPPTAKKQVNKKRNSFALPSTRHSPSSFSFDLSWSFNC